MAGKEINALYISYDGALDPLGRSQIVPYLIGLSSKGGGFTLLSYEKKQRLAEVNEVNKLKYELKRHNIKWAMLRYHKSPTIPATAFDIVAGIIYGLIIVVRDRIKIIHARSFVGAIPAFFLVKLFRLKFIFDIRGFWPQERVDAGLWKEGGLLFKIAKFFEKKFILSSDRMVVLTLKAKEILEKQYLNRIKSPIEIIPTCVDLGLFVQGAKDKYITEQINKAGRFILAYLGSLGTWYCLEEMIDFFKIAKQKISNAYFIFLTPGESKEVDRLIISRGLSSEDFLVRSVYYRDVPRWLSVCEATILFIKPLFSKKSSCPTKFAESLACGIPVIMNSGVVDCDRIITDTGAGVLVDNFSQASYAAVIDKILMLAGNRPKAQKTCRQVAERFFSLEDAVAKYNNIYQSLQ